MATKVKIPSPPPPTEQVDNNLDVEAVDRILVSEMEKLSMEERYRLKLDIEGKNMLAAIEPTELSKIGLDALDRELSSGCTTSVISNNSSRPYYNMAKAMNSPMIQQREWKLKFARAECFDPVKAAIRIEKYLEYMYKHFGKEALLRPIRLSDLNKVQYNIAVMILM